MNENEEEITTTEIQKDKEFNIQKIITLYLYLLLLVVTDIFGSHK